ncbi:MAG: hypothetical protein C4K60_08230 [Ideonella sp. MAG2]|nr:MAG: hypothetical protein C4K60_08230 [Ideonella sp. MAG2]
MDKVLPCSTASEPGLTCGRCGSATHPLSKQATAKVAKTAFGPPEALEFMNGVIHSPLMFEVEAATYRK